MRVCLVPQRYPPDLGGVASASQRYAEGLAAAGHRVSVVSQDAALAPGRSERHEAAGVLSVRVGKARRADDALSAWFEAVVAEHRAEPFDVVVGRYLGGAAFVAVYAARFLGLPSVVSARGNDVDRGAFDGSALNQLLWAVRHASAVTTVSQELRLKLMALQPGLEPLVVPNGVDTELFRPGASDPQLARQPFVLFVGEARKKKGLPVLLEAQLRVVQQMPGARLLLVGGVRADDSDILQVFARKYPAVQLEVVPELPPAELLRYYRSAAVFVMPSLHDGLPNALLEAMACGCPIVASAVGGIPDALRDGVDGRLVAPGEPASLAALLLELLNDAPQAAQLAASARERALTEFGLLRERQADIALLGRVVNGELAS